MNKNNSAAEEVAKGLLRQLEQNRADVALMKTGLPTPTKESQPIMFMGVKFYPDVDRNCWRLVPPKSSA